MKRDRLNRLFAEGVLFLLFMSASVFGPADHAGDPWILSAEAATADYRIDSADWDESASDGRAVAIWDRRDDSADSRTTYKLRLYRGDLSNPVGDWITVSGTRYNFSQQIVKKGTGTYFYQIYPAKGGETMMVTSGELEVDSTRKRQLKTYLESLSAQEEENFQNNSGGPGTVNAEGWVQRNDYWYYRQTGGTVLKSSWLSWNGKWYYLSSDGRMLTGWQAISGKWYCFDDSGALYVNTVTPDGSTVNENGEWVENGVVVTDDRKKAKKVDSSTVTVLKEFSVAVTEKQVAEGELYQVSVKNTSEAKVLEESYSIPQEQWTAGQPVTITVTYETYAGYAFAESTVCTCASATIKSQYSSEPTERTFVLSYVPGFKLKKPEGFYLDSEYRLYWDSVPSAGGYEIRFVSDGSVQAKKTVEGISVSLADYMDLSDLSVKVTAIPPADKKSWIVKSSVVTLEQVSSAEGQENLLVSGKFVKSADGTLAYRDANGTLVKDKWEKLAGFWYHFDSAGKAESPGWYLDSTGYWYYFDEKHRMLTGKITVDGKEYRLNDGTKTDIPLGARY